MRKYLISLLFGIGVGVASTFLHNSYQPIGLFISLLAIWFGSYLVGQMYLSSRSTLAYAFGWLLVIFRASSLGNGGELLIESNGYGNLLVIVGIAILIFSFFQTRKLNR